MQVVEPIRDKRKIEQIKNILRGSRKFRDLLLFELGINSALRISDLLSLQLHHLFNSDGTIKDFFELKEKKTDKRQRITITPKVKETLKEYLVEYPSIFFKEENYLFFHSRKHPWGIKQIDRQTARDMINGRCRDVGLKGRYGGHTLRKTWGYQARMSGVSIELIQHKLNHSSMAVTKRYIGITDDEIEEICLKLDL